LLLFAATKTKGIYSFEGCFALAGWEMVEAPDVDKLPRKAIVFQLVPVAEVEPTVAAELEEPLSEDKSLAELRALAIAAAETPKEPGKEARRAYYVRSATVKAYVLMRANGRCEACRDKAPFLRMDGSPYLEPHHIKRIADGGPDHPAHVGAVCPTCHRRIHHGADGKSINAELEKYVKGLEQS
jgi:5-methylcytosine-specific restriction protein A